MEQIHSAMRDAYGDFVKIPGILGRPSIILCFDPHSFEKVLRTEGPWPTRRGFETFAHYRKKVRPDIFRDTGGLLTEDGEKWFDARSKVNPVFLQPKTVKMYIEKTEQVVNDLIDQIRTIRDPKTLETTKHFGQNLKCWALESIGVIALDERIGALKGDTPEAKKVVKVN